MIIDNTKYKLTDNNYYKESYDKTQVVIGHSYRPGMQHYGSWIYRINGKNKKTSTFTIDKKGLIYQHYDPIYYSDFVGKLQDKASISITLENMGWFKKDNMVDRYVDWLGNSYKRKSEDVMMKRWRNYTYWDRYSEEQMNSLVSLVNKLCKDFNISKEFIGHNVYDENVDLYKGITFRSNYHQEMTDVSPAFDMEFFKKNIQ